MICNPFKAPWHKETFDRFIHEQLPELLAGRIPLEEYTVQVGSENYCSIVVSLTPSSKMGSEPVRTTISQIPCPDHDGLFHVDDHPVVVVPVASSENLEDARIKCVGELLFDYIDPRIGESPAELVWDEALLRSWIPIDKWVHEFLTFTGNPRERPYVTSQYLDRQNWISKHEHPRRLLLMENKEVVTAGQFGRICPVQTPEGPNVGRVLAISRGTVVENGRLKVMDRSPDAGLSLAASMIPFLECNEPTRALMGTNMMRQWHESDSPEPALVQTGNEPDEPGFWNGHNLLTAFMSAGESTFEDGIVISESAAERLKFEGVIEPGDKISNRHGTKGVISQVLPDCEMPHLPDGTPVELIFSFIGQHTRMNYGQLKEAILGRIARARGEYLFSPPFNRIDDASLKEMLREQNFSETGMEQLRDGASGDLFTQSTTVGYVYWGLTVHLSRKKVFARPRGYQRQGPAEYFQYRDLRAFHVIQELFNSGSSSHKEASSLPRRIARGESASLMKTTPAFNDLQQQLSVAGIAMNLADNQLMFSFRKPLVEDLELACAVTHPWLPEKKITHVGRLDGWKEFDKLVETNTQMKRVLNGHAPRRLLERSSDNLQQVVNSVFDLLIDKRRLCQSTRVVFSGRSVLAPGINLRWDEVMIPDELAWALFGPLVQARLPESDNVEDRTPEATQLLDEIMADQWVIIHRAPSVSPTSILGFRPIRSMEKVVRLHPFSCQLLNADYDGDQVAVLFPVTRTAQTEVQEKLSIKAHLTRNPELVSAIAPTHEAMWGLAQLSRTLLGREKLQSILEADLQLNNRIFEYHMLINGLQRVNRKYGAEKSLETAHQLFRLGFSVAHSQGASHSPFGFNKRCHVSETGEFAAKITSENGLDSVQNDAVASADFDDPLTGNQLLSVLSGARGTPEFWLQGQCCQIIESERNKQLIVKRGYLEGLTWDDYLLVAAASRRKLGDVVKYYETLGVELWQKNAPVGMNVLSRAVRFSCPGNVFARAAAIEEMDPLVDLDSRLFVGLKPIE